MEAASITVIAAGVGLGVRWIARRLRLPEARQVSRPPVHERRAATTEPKEIRT